VFFVIVFIALIGVPLLEIYVVVEVSRAIGLLATLALLIFDALAGTVLVRSQSRAVWRRARRTLLAGEVPAREVLDGALVITGGALLIAPGFITDLFGALLLMPPTRGPIRRLVIARFRRASGRPTHTPGGDFDVQSTAVEVDSQQLGGGQV
jgi:UPF0716 protein FxsA